MEIRIERTAEAMWLDRGKDDEQVYLSFFTWAAVGENWHDPEADRRITDSSSVSMSLENAIALRDSLTEVIAENTAHA